MTSKEQSKEREKIVISRWKKWADTTLTKWSSLKSSPLSRATLVMWGGAWEWEGTSLCYCDEQFYPSLPSPGFDKLKVSLSESVFLEKLNISIKLMNVTQIRGVHSGPPLRDLLFQMHPHIWQYVCVGGWMVLVLSGWRPGMLLSILQRLSQERINLAPSVSSSEVKNPELISTHI